MEMKFLIFIMTFIINIYNVISEQKERDPKYSEILNKEFVNK